MLRVEAVKGGCIPEGASTSCMISILTRVTHPASVLVGRLVGMGANTAKDSQWLARKEVGCTSVERGGWRAATPCLGRGSFHSFCRCYCAGRSVAEVRVTLGPSSMSAFSICRA